MVLNKYLAHAGICSRRKAVTLIQSGEVLVNGVVAEHPAQRVLPTDQVTLRGSTLATEAPLYILLNKPKDFITTVSDERNRRTVLDLVKHDIPSRIYPVGRLDRNTTGVLLLTNDGNCAQRLSHPQFEIQKIYDVLLEKPLRERDAQKLLDGVALYDGVSRIDALTYDPLGRGKRVQVTIHSGKYRILRRLFEELGYELRALDRVLYAGLTKKNMPVGSWRFLSPAEVAKLTQRGAV